jgi:radical SAM/Cys-rich protein
MGDFSDYLQFAGRPLKRAIMSCLQVNIGYRCNLQCSHCHVEAGPKRTESMSREVMDDVLAFAATAGVSEIDITGGAPELNPNLPHFLHQARQLPSVERVLLRTNLAILDEPGFSEFPGLFAASKVEVIASMPCYLEENVDAQRGRGVHLRNIRVLQQLNRLGYGVAESGLKLHLVYNPLGNFLPGAQAELESAYKDHLQSAFDITFNSLFTITNMPIGRFRSQLEKQGLLTGYLDLLVEKANLLNLDKVMCRTTLSVNWQGRVYDCDFNQMLKLPGAFGSAYIGEIDPQLLAGLPIATGEHCFACVAGAGSSCQGSLKAKAG